MIPVIGSRTAAALVTGIEISLFRCHDELTSYYNAATTNRYAETKLESVEISWRVK